MTSPQANEPCLAYHTHGMLATVTDGDPHWFQVGSFQVTEVLAPPRAELQGELESLNRALGRPVMVYHVVLRCPVENHAQIADRHRESRQLASDISAVWHYAFAEPFLSPMRTSHGDPALPGWTDGREAAHAMLPSEGPRIGPISTRQHHAKTFSCWPLPVLMRCLHAFSKMDPLHRYLVELHRQALEMPIASVRLLLFAKAADLLQIVLPGGNDRKRIAGIPDCVRKHLRLGDKALGLAHYRLQTRHAADKQSKTLHQSMTPAEEADFQSDVDLLVRYVMAVRSGADIVPDDRWRRPPNRTSMGPVLTIKLGAP